MILSQYYLNIISILTADINAKCSNIESILSSDVLY